VWLAGRGIDILTEGFRGLLQSLQAGIMPEIGLNAASFPVHYSVTILSFDTTLSYWQCH
jgi:hypothetical protein